jgi:hypothetical protein
MTPSDIVGVADRGLCLDLAGIPAVSASNVNGEIADSFKAFFGGIFSFFSKRYFWPFCQLAFGNEIVDNTVPQRIVDDLTYRPKNDSLTEALKQISTSA